MTVRFATICGVITLVSSVGFSFPKNGKCTTEFQFTEAETKADLDAAYDMGKLETIATISNSESLQAYVVPTENGGKNMYYYLKSGEKMIGIYDDSTNSGSSSAVIDVQVKSKTSFEFTKTAPKSTTFGKFNNYVVSIEVSGIENKTISISKWSAIL